VFTQCTYNEWIVGSVILKKIGQIFDPKKRKRKNIELYTLKIIRKKYPIFVSETQQKNTGHQGLFVFWGGAKFHILVSKKKKPLYN
jgi:hypothetical protein